MRKKYKVIFKRKSSNTGMWRVEEFYAREKSEMIEFIQELKEKGYDVEIMVNGEYKNYAYLNNLIMSNA